MTDIIDIIEQKFLAGKVKVAARNYGMEGQPYRPTSGTEGAAFQERWCDHCARDAAFRADPDFGTGCQIVADTFAYDITDPKYPKEWVFDAEGRPKCTAFTTDPACPVRCDKTIDLFGDH